MMQIQEPALEALIMERLRTGSFESVEQTLMDALQRAPLPAHTASMEAGATGMEILAAFQRCPMQDLAFGSDGCGTAIMSDPVRF